MSAPTPMQDNSSFDLQAWPAALRMAAKQVFSIMLATELKDPEQSDPVRDSELTAMIGLAGSISGVLSLRCSAAVSTEIAARMLGLSGSDAEAHRCDAVGETCNMVAGAFKANLPELENTCMLSVPTVITGDNYAVHSLVAGSRIEVPLLFGEEVIWLALEMSN